MRMTVFFLLGCLVSFAGSAIAGEAKADFTASKVQLHQDGRLIRATGIITNHTGKEFKKSKFLIEFHDAKGRVIATVSASIDDFGADAKSDFIGLVLGKSKGWKSTTVKLQE